MTPQAWRVLLAVGAAACGAVLVHVYPDPEWWDELAGGGLALFALLTFILP